MREESLTEFDQVLARHLVIDAKRMPAHRPVGLPLQLAPASGDGGLEFLVGVGIAPADRAALRVMREDRNLHDHARLRVDGEEGRIGRRAFFAERGQHDRLDLVKTLQHAKERGVEPAGGIGLGRGHEFVVEAEAVEEPAQPRVVMRGEAVVFAERVRHLRQRLAEMGGDDLAVRDVVRDLAQAVHVVGEGDEARLHLVVGQDAEGVADHGRPRDLAERADMRQARGAVAGLEDDLRFRRAPEALDHLARLLERPGL